MWKSLYFWVIAAIIAGFALGAIAPETAIAMKPLGDGFIKLIKMLIAPVIFCTVVTGIAGMRSMKNAGRVGMKAIIYFEVLTTLALVLGLVVVNLYNPGGGMHVDMRTLDSKAVESYTAKPTEDQGVAEFLIHVIPNTLFDAFAKGDMLQVLLVSILFAAGLLSLGDRGHHLYQLIQQFSDVTFRMIGFVIKLAPLGAFGAMAYTVGKYGISSLGPLANLILAFYVTCAIFVFGALGIVMRLCGLRILPFLRYLKEELLIVFGTSSSEPALPRLMEKMVTLGCSRAVVGMVVPTGYSFNLDGTSLYLTMAAIFIAQATGTSLDLEHQLLLLGVLLLTSKGAAGVTGSGFVVLAASLSTVGHIPVEGLALILGIDRFMSLGRAITNFIGNAVATVVVSRWEHAIDMDQAQAALGITETPSAAETVSPLAITAHAHALAPQSLNPAA
ncbi:MAG: C4-dicarboxylate transporter DctA [Alphaproteobacteria bacterium]|nr:C4-dicarboxylate transporter DctA [Alphaproteobacteria bacterium]